MQGSRLAPLSRPVVRLALALAPLVLVGCRSAPSDGASGPATEPEAPLDVATARARWDAALEATFDPEPLELLEWRREVVEWRARANELAGWIVDASRGTASPSGWRVVPPSEEALASARQLLANPPVVEGLSPEAQLAAWERATEELSELSTDLEWSEESFDLEAPTSLDAEDRVRLDRVRQPVRIPGPDAPERRARLEQLDARIVEARRSRDRLLAASHDLDRALRAARRRADREAALDRLAEVRSRMDEDTSSFEAVHTQAATEWITLLARDECRARVRVLEETIEACTVLLERVPETLEWTDERVDPGSPRKTLRARGSQPTAEQLARGAHRDYQELTERVEALLSAEGAGVERTPRSAPHPLRVELERRLDELRDARAEARAGAEAGTTDDANARDGEGALRAAYRQAAIDARDLRDAQLAAGIDP